MDEAIKKYEELYHLYLKLHGNSIEQNRQLDDKAAKFVSFYSVLIAAVGIIGLVIRTTGDILPSGWTRTLIYVIFFLILVTALLGLCFLFKAMGIREFSEIPHDETVVKYFKESPLIDIYYHIPLQLKEGIEHNDHEALRKARHIWFATLCGWFAITLFVLNLIIIAAVIKPSKPEQQREKGASVVISPNLKTMKNYRAVFWLYGQTSSNLDEEEQDRQ